MSVPGGRSAIHPRIHSLFSHGQDIFIAPAGNGGRFYGALLVN